MHFYSLRKVIYGTLISTLIALTLTGCMNNISSQPSQHSGTISTSEVPTTTAEPSQAQSIIPLNQNASFNLTPLNIQAKALGCLLDSFLYDSGLNYSGGNVVLTNPSTSFDEGAIANLETSLEQNNPSLLPNGFATVLAGFFGPRKLEQTYGCDEDLEITNTSQDLIQITQITLRYTANSRPNLQHYNLIDICSLPDVASRFDSPGGICSGGRGSGRGPILYDFQLINGKSGTIISSLETYPISLEPGETVKVKLELGPANTSNGDYIYSFVPQLTLSTSSQPQALYQLTSTAVFVSQNLVSCYRLQHDYTFLQMNNLTAGSNPVRELDNQGNIFWPECV